MDVCAAGGLFCVECIAKSRARGESRTPPSKIPLGFADGARDRACTLAMEAGMTDRLWSREGMVALVDEWEAREEIA